MNVSSVWCLGLSAALLGYFCGSVPCGLLAGRAAGIDIRQHGSGNIGATNVLRVLGKKYGYAVFAADVFKGWIGVHVSAVLARRFGLLDNEVQLVAVAAAVTCILGHSFPVWLGFKGGKGVATSAGAVLGLMPLAAIIIALFWLVVFKATRYVSVASIVAAAILPLFIVMLQRFQNRSGSAVLWFTIVMAAVVIWRHRSNIQRLAAGTEPRFARK
jgi:glycerol-3-phosphate acyltransferase PlsY